MCYNEGVRVAGEKCSAFFEQFYHIFAPQEKYTPLVEWENLRYP